MAVTAPVCTDSPVGFTYLAVTVYAYSTPVMRPVSVNVRASAERAFGRAVPLRYTVNPTKAPWFTACGAVQVRITEAGAASAARFVGGKKAGITIALVTVFEVPFGSLYTATTP